ncbi:Dam family site-specific DNA-(adenine-N6)-methyltransferase [Thiohalospira halophila]|uniref:Dam family site-specific DNA-(adenine-N6)-methyltransferase n=1 Tax=Thiohalospira halophila TaxID=381300 RepID=UPI001F07F0A7|nr:Dam family site-specific DNA-(adenine-N6)-methyltransferase [Thiohalospira halophila]
MKWAGNKHRLLDRILPRLPAGHRLIEPFAGAAAVTLAADYPAYRLVDSNPDLIGLFRAVRDGGEAFIEQVRALFADGNDAATYYARREAFNAETDPEARAALFLYLNRHGYNGLCRYNRGGGFNVPFGRYARPYFPETELRGFLRLAWTRGIELAVSDFEAELDGAQPGDVVYCDPPYAPAGEGTGFTDYGPDGFWPADQVRLVAAARRAAARGVPVLLSNHDTEPVRASCAGAAIESFPVARTISRQGTGRRPVDEVLVRFEPASLARAGV